MGGEFCTCRAFQYPFCAYTLYLYEARGFWHKVTESDKCF